MITQTEKKMLIIIIQQNQNGLHIQILQDIIGLNMTIK